MTSDESPGPETGFTVIVEATSATMSLGAGFDRFCEVLANEAAGAVSYYEEPLGFKWSAVISVDFADNGLTAVRHALDVIHSAAARAGILSELWNSSEAKCAAITYAEHDRQLAAQSRDETSPA